MVKRAERAIDSFFFTTVEVLAEPEKSSIVVLDTSKELPSGLRLSQGGEQDRKLILEKGSLVE